MRNIKHIYINGEFIAPQGRDTFPLTNPATGKNIGTVRLGDGRDIDAAVAAAKAALPAMARTTLAQRGAMLQRLHNALLAHGDEIAAAEVEEYGGTVDNSLGRIQFTATVFLLIKQTMENYPFERTVGQSQVVMEPLGVVGIITPWNAGPFPVANKLATAIAAGCTAVIKPSELSALQTQVLLKALHAADLPPGVVNIVHGLGQVAGAALASHPDVAKISFTGSTATGKAIARAAAETLKRVTLELGGKSANILLDDVDLESAIPAALRNSFYNNGQACIAGTRLLVPAHKLDEVKRVAKTAAEAFRVGDPACPQTELGPLVSRAQYERVQRYIELGIEQGAELVAGGPGAPAGLRQENAGGFFVRPTVFANVTPDMAIAREEIFGPVLSILSYRSEEEAVAIANGTMYGLSAYVSSGDPARAEGVARQLVAGRVHVNGLHNDMLAPFGGFRQSGLGRELGPFGLEAYLEPKAILGLRAQ